MMYGNSSWIAAGYFIGSLAMVIENLIFMAMNLRAIMKWSKLIVVEDQQPESV